MGTRALTVVLLSSHLYCQPRKGGFHWLCDSFVRQGHQIRFVTVDFSLMTLLKGDRRTRHGQVQGLGRLRRVEPRVSTGVMLTLTHPVGSGTGMAARALGALTQWYPGPLAFPRLPALVADADVVIFESNASLFLARDVRRHSRARLIYRVSDDLQVIRPVPALLRAEREAVRIVDAVSVASPVLAQRFADARQLRIDPMGIDKQLFDDPQPSPYGDDSRPKIVCSGSSGFDAPAFEAAARLTPQALFVMIGEAPRIPLPNVLQLGEQPFEAVVPYVAHADVGFAPFRVKPGVEYQADHSNRLLQYTYCGLPSVVPHPLALAERRHFFGYDAQDRSSIGETVRAAMGYDRSLVPRHSVLSWGELAQRLLATA